ncbi:hypothetical protein AVEN_223938-1 [Araneus ventricosus]|uniref:Uncharacterized protein n=1 Tax=Araneus ventricosus TaxID=182803 RepID=A0A4Y2MQA7_ARAVE|nr:hypothetical protein AVEN_223938-1 [Araneus ventricosus]
MGLIHHRKPCSKACGLDKPRLARVSYSWTVEFEHSRRCEYLFSARVNRSPSGPLTCELFTATTRETTDALTSQRATSILRVPTTGNNTNRGRNMWKDRSMECSFKHPPLVWGNI